MKKLILTFGLVVAVAMVSFAQAVKPNTSTTEEVTKKDQTDPKKIKFEEAPAAVQEAFTSSEYSKESIKEVHEIKENAQKAYKIVVDVNNQKWALKYDTNGKLIDKKEVM